MTCNIYILYIFVSFFHIPLLTMMACSHWNINFNFYHWFSCWNAFSRAIAITIWLTILVTQLKLHSLINDCSKSPIYSLQWFLTWFAYLQSKFFAMTDKLVWDFFRSSLHSNRSCWHSWGKFKSCVHKRWGLNCNIILDCIVCKCFFSYYEPWFNFLRESLQLVFLGFFQNSCYIHVDLPS